MNFANVTLGELLSSKNDTIQRNALSILKQLQKKRDEQAHCDHDIDHGAISDPCRKCGILTT